ncbi:hypothetical protein [Bacillus sp. FJAT-45350]|uniref:hypothetical protein n=1 Tax=Bacillus sp. FJAT-45350 TaxID=2011014 RepID=UPI000BB757A3|nr:hypothetical protein [Bacillus sp. FJAT-45350]
MQIIVAEGKELEKEKPNTSEDFFNRSTVRYVDGGQEKEFNLLYVRYFDELVSDFTPYESDPIFTVGAREVTFKDIVALVCLAKNQGYKEKKRIYLNDQKEFGQMFHGVNYDKVSQMFEELESKGAAEVANILID